MNSLLERQNTLLSQLTESSTRIEARMAESSSRIEAKLDEILEEIREQGATDRRLIGHSLQLVKTYHGETMVSSASSHRNGRLLWNLYTLESCRSFVWFEYFVSDNSTSRSFAWAYQTFVNSMELILFFRTFLQTWSKLSRPNGLIHWVITRQMRNFEDRRCFRNEQIKVFLREKRSLPNAGLCPFRNHRFSRLIWPGVGCIL